MNGRPGVRFRSTGGLRQGDPLSSYLFLPCAEGLSSLLNRAEQRGMMSGVATAKGGIKLTHILFADDYIIFSKARKEDWKAIHGVLQVYEKAFGQVLNQQKTSILFSSNTKKSIQSAILQEAGAVLCGDYRKYLRLPSMIG